MVLEIGKGADGGLFLRGAKKLSTLELLNSCMRASQIKAGPIPSSRAQNQQRQHRPHRAGASSRPRLHENTFWRRGNCRPAPPPPSRRPEGMSWRAAPYWWAYLGSMKGEWLLEGKGKVSTCVPTFACPDSIVA